MPRRRSKKSATRPKRNVPEPIREATQRETAQSDEQADEAPFFPPEPEPVRGARGAHHAHDAREKRGK